MRQRPAPRWLLRTLRAFIWKAGKRLALFARRYGVPVRRVFTVEPIGFPHSALVCGSRGCEQPAFVWLEGAEKMDFDSGVRVFAVGDGHARVRAI